MSTYGTLVTLPVVSAVAEEDVVLPRSLRRSLFLVVGALCVMAAVVTRPGRGAAGAAGAASAFGATVPASSSASNVDGGGWTLVRCVSSQEGTWHPAKDMLHGTEVYGEPHSADGTWSVAWAETDYSELLLGLTDLSYWVVIDESQLYNYGDPVMTTISTSSASSTPYKAEWYLRSAADCAASTKDLECGQYGAFEDPWASVYDHTAEEPGMVYGEDALTGNMDHLGVDGVGACVWVR